MTTPLKMFRPLLRTPCVSACFAGEYLVGQCNSVSSPQRLPCRSFSPTQFMASDCNLTGTNRVCVVIVLRMACNATTRRLAHNVSRHLFCLAVLVLLFVLCCNLLLRRSFVSHVHPVVIVVSGLDLINAPNVPEEFIFKVSLAVIQVLQISFRIHLDRHVCPAVLAVPTRVYPRYAQALQTQSVTWLYLNALRDNMRQLLLPARRTGSVPPALIVAQSGNKLQIRATVLTTRFATSYRCNFTATFCKKRNRSRLVERFCIKEPPELGYSLRCPSF